MMIDKNIYLIGMMGSWKTTVGRLLAKKLKRNFVDLDDQIEKAAGLIIAHIFEIFSEAEFRSLEAKQLRKIAQLENQVVGTGGGAVLQEKNRRIFLEDGITIFLRAEPAVLASRIRNKSKRPLLMKSDNIENTLREIWEKRQALYEASAHYILDTDELKPEEVTEEIVAYLQENYEYNPG